MVCHDLDHNMSHIMRHGDSGAKIGFGTSLQFF